MFPAVAPGDWSVNCRNELCTTSFDERNQCWLHVIIVIRNIQNGHAFSTQILSKFLTQFTPVILLHD